MRRFTFLLCTLLIFVLGSPAYSLTNFWYNGYALDATGQVLPNTTVNVRVSIYNGTTLAYQETHTGVPTDQFASLTVEVGTGTVLTPGLAGITTTANTKIMLETNNGPGWVLSAIGSIAQVLSVNILNNIENVTWSLEGNTGTTPGTNFIGTTDNAALHMDVRNGATLSHSLRLGTNQAIYRETAVAGVTGNARGQYAVDMQIYRTVATQVASGAYSTVGGGYQNTASSDASTVAGGYQNTASGYTSTVGGGYQNIASGYTVTVGGGESNTASAYSSAVAGGWNNTASGSYSTVGGGYQNTASGNGSTVDGGQSNTASGQYSKVGGGYGNTASGSVSTVGGGAGNTASGDYSTVGGGLNAVANKYGQNAYASGAFSTSGDAQTSVFVARRQTSAAGWTTLFLNGQTENLSIPNNATWFFKIYIIAKPTGGTTNGAAYEITGAVTNNGGTATLLGTPTVTTIYESVGAYNAQVTVSGANLVVQVEGNGDALRWVARIETAEVTW